jgi:hypothetical protein
MSATETEFDDDDVGKKVVHGDDTVGRVTDVEYGTAYVDPDPGLTDKLKAKLGWSDGAGDEDTFPIQSAAVAEVTDDEVRLTRDL